MVRWAREGSTWRIGTDVEVAWIADGTSIGRTITLVDRMVERALAPAAASPDDIPPGRPRPAPLHS